MESVLTQNAKTIAPQDAVLNLLSTTKASDDGEQFGKVFEDTSKKLTTEEEEEAKRSEEQKKKNKEINAGAYIQQSGPVEQQGKKNLNKSEQTTGESGQTKADEQSKRLLLEARKRQQRNITNRTRTRGQEKQQLAKADQAKAEQVREQNTLSKPLTPQLNPVPKEMTPQVAARDGTQVASKIDNMTMPSKLLAPKPEVKPVLVEEVRPATSAETSPRSGQQSAQQDLPKETPKETVLPVTPVQSATPAATSVTSVQAAATTQAALNPMLEKIWDAVTTFRVRGENEMTVKVQPDNDTELQLTIKYSTGGVEIEARMQQGDGRQLASGWNELQQQLSERGVNLGDLASEDSEETTRDSDPRQFNRQGQPQHPTPEFQVGDEEADWAALGMAATRDKETTRAATPESTDKVEEAYDGWQSWA